MHKTYLAIGLVLLLSGFFGNLFIMWLISELPIGGPPIVGTGILLLIPVGILLIFVSLIRDDQDQNDQG
jgi:hypothetical protein